jgi:hypothetical protein
MSMEMEARILKHIFVITAKIHMEMNTHLQQQLVSPDSTHAPQKAGRKIKPCSSLPRPISSPLPHNDGTWRSGSADWEEWQRGNAEVRDRLALNSE